MQENHMNYEAIDEIVGSSATMNAAIENVCDAFYGKGQAELVYGYIVHLHCRHRNDILFSVSRSTRLEESFYSVGGAATDFVISGIEKINVPFAVDIKSLVEQTQDADDIRKKFVSDIFESGHRTVWVAPIKGPGLIGFGVLNHSLKEPNAQPAISPEYLSLMAYYFHQALRRHGLLAKQFQLTEKEIETLKLVAQGRSAEDIACRIDLGQRAVELRLENVRKKLKARNIAETLYKACAYGVLN